MKLDEEGLSLLFADPASYPPRSDRGCPKEETFRRAAQQELGRAERKLFADHLVECPDCAAEYRLLLSLEPLVAEAAALVGEPTPFAVRSRESQAGPNTLLGLPTYAAALAAGVLLVVGLSFGILWKTRRAAPPSAAERGPEPLALRVDPADGAVLSKPPARLRWSALEGAESYQAALYDLESTPVWKSAKLTRTEAELPRQVTELLRRGRPYFWQVFARTGIEERGSPLFEFVISP